MNNFLWNCKTYVLYHVSENRYSDTCKELLEDDKVIMEDSCTSPRYENIHEFTLYAKLLFFLKNFMDIYNK